METELGKFQQEPQAIRRVDRSIKFVKAKIEILKEYLIKHPFSSKPAEVEYFKRLAPIFYSRHFYFIKVYNLELHRLGMTHEKQLGYLEQELVGIEQYYINNGYFAKYVFMESNHLDEQFFIRGGFPESWILDEVSIVIDENFCLGSYRLSWILAYGEYRNYVEQEIGRIRNPPSQGFIQFAGRKYEFAGTNRDAAEWIQSFVKKKVIKIDGKEADTKTLAQAFESLFERRLGNIYDIHRDNMRRKKESTPFLNSLIRALLEK